MATASTHTQLTGVSVLAVDDDRSTLEALSLVLESRGARVYAAHSAATALALRETDVRLDVIVSDVSMRGTDGLAMLATIRAAERAAGSAPTPAVAVSGYVAPEDQMRAIAAGYQMHLAKPIDLEVLVKAIRDLSGRDDDRSETTNSTHA